MLPSCLDTRVILLYLSQRALSKPKYWPPQIHQTEHNTAISTALDLDIAVSTFIFKQSSGSDIQTAIL